jgi:hypothetical protein
MKTDFELQYLVKSQLENGTWDHIWNEVQLHMERCIFNAMDVSIENQLWERLDVLPMSQIRGKQELVRDMGW